LFLLFLTFAKEESTYNTSISKALIMVENHFLNFYLIGILEKYFLLCKK
jgi:hypothetical protein